MRSVRICFVWLALLASASQARADDLHDCGQGEPARRIAACSKIIARGGVARMELPAAYVSRGRAYIQSRAYDKAIADLTQAVRLAPKLATAYSHRGWAHIEMGNYDQAITDLNEALRLEPQLYRAHNLRGWAFAGKRDFEQALVDLDQAVRADPNHAGAFNNRGWVHLERGNHAQALLDLNEALRLEPGFAMAHYNRGNTYRASGNLDKAIADYGAALRLDPNLLRAYAARGLAFERKGDSKRALADYQRGVKVTATTASDRQRQAVMRERIARLTRPPRAKASGRVALVIGNSAYASVGLLANPRNDARAVAAALRRLGFAHVAEHYDLDQATMNRALKDFGDRALGAEWAVVFFAGHGIEVNGTNYLLPVDAQLKRDTHAADEAISLDRVQAKVDAASKLGLIILDACRSNPFVARMVRTGGRVRAVGRGFAITEPEGNALVAYAARHGTFAEDGTGLHSPFTEALLAHLEEPGLEVNLLFRRIRDDVRKKTERRQEPFVYGSLGSEPLYFKTAVAR